ncbi:MAG: efflux RND transporter periplasmic adaptor subunit [Lachnospiraceae bacterium]|nr:efflux RND transporter periplasmic adaptor subunit [Lachnospiraceae bacterium]
MGKLKSFLKTLKGFFAHIAEGIKGLSKKKKVILAAVLILIISTSLAFSVFGKKKVQQVVVLPETTTLQTGSFSERISASGTTEATNVESIFIELSQEVKEVFAEVGDEVEEGQLLVTYDIEDTKRELNNKLVEAQATLENAELTLESLASPATGTDLIDLKNQVVSAQKTLSDAEYELSNADAKITQAENDYNDAKTTMENYKALYEIGGVTKSEYESTVSSCEDARLSYESAVHNKETYESSVEAAKLSLEKSKINLSVGLNKLSDEENAQSYKKQESTVNTAKVNLESIQMEIDKLAEATYSPISGTVIESNAVAGQMLSDSTVMMKIADLSDISLTAYVSEYDISKVQVGQSVEMTSDGIEDKTYHGTVTKIEPTAVSQSTISGSETVVQITVHMDDSDENVRSGVSFDMEIIVVDIDDAQYLPISSIVMDTDGNSYVYVVDDSGKLVKTAVEIGANSDTSMQVVSGLSDTDKVISSPTDDMQDGANLTDYQTIQYVESGSTESSEDSLLDGILPSGNTSGGGMPSGGGPSGGGPSGGGMSGGGMR